MCVCVHVFCIDKNGVNITIQIRKRMQGSVHTHIPWQAGWINQRLIDTLLIVIRLHFFIIFFRLCYFISRSINSTENIIHRDDKFYKIVFFKTCVVRISFQTINCMRTNILLLLFVSHAQLFKYQFLSETIEISTGAILVTT